MKKLTRKDIKWTYRNISVRCGHCGHLRMKLNAIKVSDSKLVFACNACTNKMIEQE